MADVQTRVETRAVVGGEVPMTLRSVKAGLDHLRAQAGEFLVMLDAVEAEVDTAVMLHGMDCL